ncbi:hypothetical protein SAMN05192566_1545 [Methylophilus rhizosphaerae]|uniref:Abi-like protein n=1 Tax=Methylophilus rhizosphaerae TaxID=492660 RepID=A0A1G9CN54_9PROT|nr:Abi family protein [Methylophilus rhizosphaerae]SDK53110.1 hypothetical protein SAMN05192566_1545 [Methylophilus rhizosphaerae]
MPVTPLMAGFICETITRSRLTSFHANVAGGSDSDAVRLYLWNANLSSSLLLPIALLEVVLRNAVSEAISNTYGPNWHQNNAFILSLPDPKAAYSPRRDLINTAAQHQLIGKTIPELKFAFWRDMFTKRHQGRIWGNELRKVFPNAPHALSESAVRLHIYHSLTQIKTLRNRVAHHEPIFQRNTQSDFDLIKEIIEMRCSASHYMLLENEIFTQTLANRP